MNNIDSNVCLKVCVSREIERVSHMVVECKRYGEGNYILVGLVNSKTDEWVG